MAGPLRDFADLVVTGPVQAGVMTVTAVATRAGSPPGGCSDASSDCDAVANNGRPTISSSARRPAAKPRIESHMTNPSVTSSQSATTEPLVAESISASITVNDLGTSVAWYRDALGFQVEREIVRDGTLRAVAMSAGAVRVMLNQDDGAKGTDRVKGAGLSLMLTTRQSIDGIASRIAASGTRLEMEPADMPWGARVFRVKDPDGFLLVVSSPRA